MGYMVEDDPVSKAIKEHMSANASFTKRCIVDLKRRLGITSDYALAKHLRVSKTTVSNYSNGVTAFSPAVCFRVAEILGTEPGIIISGAEMDRHSGAEQKELDTWSWIHKATQQFSKAQAGAARLAVLVMIAFVALAGVPREASAAPYPTAEKPASLYIMLN